jgi:hypothetical protein
MLKVIMELHRACLKALSRELEDHYPTRATQDRKDIMKHLMELPVREKISKMKFIPEDQQAQFDEMLEEIETQMAGIFKGGA